MTGIVSILLIVIAGFAAACGNNDRNGSNLRGGDGLPSEQSAYIHGTITVDEALDDTRDYSGISLYVLDHSGSQDTLFRAHTDREGRFDGEAMFSRQDGYLLEVHRNERRIADTTLILAHQDTIHITGELPRFSGHASISSVENDAMQVLNRLERQYNRVVQIAAAGGVSQDTIPQILDNWSNIYWEVFETYPGTVAARVAARESMRMLEEHNDEKILRRLREHGDDEAIRRIAAQFGFMSVLRRDGLDDGIAWLDSLEGETPGRNTRRLIAMNRIEVLYDSARTDEARSRIARFEEEFGEDEDSEMWLESLRYDIEYLSRGQELPLFRAEFLELTDSSVFDRFPDGDGDTRTLTRADLQGAPAMIEIVRLSDRTYQQSYQQLRMFHMIFRDEGIRFLTFPLEENPVALRAFFNEQGQDWPVAKAGAFAESDLDKKWNVSETPIRFIIDGDGRIVRKLYGHNLNEILIELNTLLTNGEL